MTDANNDITESTDPPKSPTRFIKWIVLGAVVLVAVVYGAIFIYANVINDSPDALDETDLSNALTATTGPVATADTPPVSDTVAPDTTTDDGSTPTSDSTPTSEAPAGDNPDDFDGNWVATTASEFGYRVEEVLAGVNTTAVGRSSEIDGLLTIDATSATAVDVTVQVENITSDDSRRDGQFSGRIMNAAEFPTAEFRITEPIEFGEIPVGDEQITARAVGELTLRGVTNPVAFDVTAQTTDGRIGVLGSIPVLFEDYGIDNPSFGVVATEDNGLVEFVLVFERA